MIFTTDLVIVGGFEQPINYYITSAVVVLLVVVSHVMTSSCTHRWNDVIGCVNISNQFVYIAHM